MRGLAVLHHQQEGVTLDTAQVSGSPSWEHEDAKYTVTGRKLLLTVNEAARALSLGRTVVYRLVRRDEIHSVKVGRSRRIVATSLQEFVERLLTAQVSSSALERVGGDTNGTGGQTR